MQPTKLQIRLILTLQIFFCHYPSQSQKPLPVSESLLPQVCDHKQHVRCEHRNRDQNFNEIGTLGNLNRDPNRQFVKCKGQQGSKEKFDIRVTQKQSPGTRSLK